MHYAEGGGMSVGGVPVGGVAHQWGVTMVFP